MELYLFSRCVETEWRAVDILCGSVGSEWTLVRVQVEQQLPVLKQRYSTKEV